MGGAPISSAKTRSVDLAVIYERAELKYPGVVSVGILSLGPFQQTVGGKQTRSVLIDFLTFLAVETE